MKFIVSFPEKRLVMRRTDTLGEDAALGPFVFKMIDSNQSCRHTIHVFSTNDDHIIVCSICILFHGTLNDVDAKRSVTG